MNMHMRMPGRVLCGEECDEVWKTMFLRTNKQTFLASFQFYLGAMLFYPSGAPQTSF